MLFTLKPLPLLTFPWQHPEGQQQLESSSWPLKYYLAAYSDPDEFKCDSPRETDLGIIEIEFWVHIANPTNKHSIGLSDLDSGGIPERMPRCGSLSADSTCGGCAAWRGCPWGLPQKQQDMAGLCWPIFFLGWDKFSTFLFVPYRMSFFLVIVDILLLVHDAGESLFKETLWIFLKQFWE